MKFCTYHVQFGVLRVVVLHDWIVAGSVVRNKEGPSLAITIVLVATVQDIGMEEEGVTRFHLHLHKREYLRRIS